MARVNRTTGFFLLLGVLALLGTVAGSMKMIESGDTSGPPAAPPAQTAVYAAGNVDSVGGLSNLVPSILAGRVVAIKVKENDLVKAGQELVQLDDTQPRNDLRVAEQALEVSRAQFKAARELAQRHIQEYELKVIESEGALARATVAYEAAGKEWKKAQEYANKRLDGGAEFRLSQAETAVLMARKNFETTDSALKKLKTIDPKTSLKEHEEGLKEAELKVKAAKELLDAYVIRAPKDGIIYEINYHVGGSAPLPPGDPNAGRALVFCPTDGLVLRVEIDQEVALDVRPGLDATMTFRTARGELKWKGQVERVANYIEKRRARTMDPDTFNDSRTRECIIRIHPEPKQQLLHGMRMGVQIHTN